MAPDTIYLAGGSDEKPQEIPFDDAARRLLGYNRVAVKLYDYANTDDLADA